MSIRNLLVQEHKYDDDLEEDVHKRAGTTSESDEDMEVSNVRLSVVTCIYTKARDEDWHISSVFTAYIAQVGKVTK